MQGPIPRPASPLRSFQRPVPVDSKEEELEPEMEIYGKEYGGGG